MKINLEFGADGRVRAYMKMERAEIATLGGNPYVASSILDAFHDWVIDITSEIVLAEDELPDQTINTRMFEPGLDFSVTPEDGEEDMVGEDSEHRHTAMPDYMKDIKDIFDIPKEE